jgi:hypothetical protein
VDVTQEWEGKPLGFGVRSMREWAIGANGQNRRATLPDLRIDLDQAGELRRSNTAPVEAVENEHHVLSPERRQRDVTSGSGWQREVGSGLTKA